MLLIHQRKSAGTSLIYTLSDLLAVNVDTDLRITTFNAKGKRLHHYLENFIAADAPIKSVHLHPTRENFNWVKYNKIKCVALLRNPDDSWEALARHREIDNRRIQNNCALYYRESRDVLCEFYNNWAGLRHEEHVCVVYFEELIANVTGTINKILSFYGAETRAESIELKKMRYSGSQHAANALELLPPITKPTFRYSPDYAPPWLRAYRRIKRMLKRLL